MRLALGGIAVRVDRSWLVALPLLLWSLAEGAFPALVPELGRGVYWGMAALASGGVILSLLVRELVRVAVMRRSGMAVTESTMLVFGSVTEADPRPTRGGAECALAASGFLTALLLALALLVASFKLTGPDTPLALIGVSFLLGGYNGMVALFNLIPAYPLDGGRLVRVLAAYRIPDPRRASRTAAALGAVLAVMGVLAGLFVMAAIHLLAGAWLALSAALVADAALRARRKAA